ncbi:NAD(P)H-binding protein [Rothia kristinae]|uniref:SDR family oxidoreductase n=1 Tax=Rothia kristinae TaxID=37923 RepID=UPI0007749DDD|nr:NAD(P)H-binding protein [Rothia kristinae]MCA1169292.1 NAD(P)H-binding protein [Rothia kristinae]MCT1357362.1 NAD(P)H-binding protein [Rothia kristinae]MCT1505309.1 NAD(P)H-binding protein [Rothia kristinae]MCT2037718.1 NAD(P)H-binding protein [Rothia kristinae]MCT2245254.1 NAD(P)H-binding protein [Rothia kristinae]
MTRIAVAGASGAIGTLVLHDAAQAGLDTVSLDRAHGIDLLTGEGLAAALEGVTAVIDVSQVAPPDHENPTGPILRAAGHLLEAAQAAGVRRLVMLSINGVQDEGLQQFPFYAARAAQEELVGRSSVEHLIVRSAQWFEFGMNPAAVTEEQDRVRAQDWAIQPLAAASVASFLVEAAQGQHGAGMVTLAGPDRMRLPELTERTLRARGDRRPVHAEDPVLPGLGDGTLHAPSDARILGPGLAQWLEG